MTDQPNSNATAPTDKSSQAPAEIPYIPVSLAPHNAQPAGANSNAPKTKGKREREPAEHAKHGQNSQNEAGATPTAHTLGGPSADVHTRETWAQATNRWVLEGRRWETDRFRKDIIKQCVAAGMPRSDARDHAWTAAIAQFPPSGQSPETVATPEPASPTTRGDSGRVRGLADIPDAWPELPDNASLQAEVAWVQAQRLRIVEERASGAIHVYLDRARAPAPSWAALGWLETSIRSYAKFIDVAAKAMSSQVDEQDHVRRERMAIEEIRELLREMHEE